MKQEINTAKYQMDLIVVFVITWCISHKYAHIVYKLNTVKPVLPNKKVKLIVYVVRSLNLSL